MNNLSDSLRQSTESQRLADVYRVAFAALIEALIAAIAANLDAAQMDRINAVLQKVIVKSSTRTATILATVKLELNRIFHNRRAQ